MKFVITGGAGFIGSNIAEELSKDSNIEVVIIDDLSSGKIENLDSFIKRENVKFIEGSIADKELLDEITRDADGIFHEAAIASVQRSIEEPDYTNEVNLTGTLNILNAARKNNINKVVMASSASNYGDIPDLPLNEDYKPKPMSPYAVQKLTGEYYADVFSKLYGIDAVALRYFNVYGPRQDPKSPYSGVISIFAERIASGLPITIFGDGLQTRDFIYVGDVVRANLLVMGLVPDGDGFRFGRGASSGVYNVATGKETNLIELAETLMEVYGKKVDIIFEERKAGDIYRSLADTRKAILSVDEGGFGFCACVGVREGLFRLRND